MPRRTDIESILIIGSGPIIIGQACEFDYSGTQACRVLRAEGYRVVLANSNPATIMTDPDFADATYVEPLTADVLARIIERERPDALLPTLGGQTALNLAMELTERGVLEANGCEMIGASAEAIACAEDRERFKAAMVEVGLAVPPSMVARSLDEAMEAPAVVGLPVIVRPAYILGGRGTGMAGTVDELAVVAAEGLAASPIGEILIERSIAGREIECAVLGNDEPIVSVAGEVIPHHEFYSYEAKYLDEDGAELVIPAALDPPVTVRAQELALAAFRALCCDGMARVDFFLQEDGTLLVNELNTIPGFTRISMYPKLWEASGIPYSELIERLLRLGIERHERERHLRSD